MGEITSITEIYKKAEEGRYFFVGHDGTGQWTKMDWDERVWRTLFGWLPKIDGVDEACSKRTIKALDLGLQHSYTYVNPTVRAEMVIRSIKQPSNLDHLEDMIDYIAKTRIPQSEITSTINPNEIQAQQIQSNISRTPVTKTPLTESEIKKLTSELSAHIKKGRTLFLTLLKSTDAKKKEIFNKLIEHEKNNEILLQRIDKLPKQQKKQFLENKEQLEEFKHFVEENKPHL